MITFECNNSFRMNAAGEVIDKDDDAYNYEEDIQRMHVLFETYLFYEQVMTLICVFGCTWVPQCRSYLTLLSMDR